MKTLSTKSLLKHSIISLLLVGFFVILATGSLAGLYEPFGISVTKTDKGGGIYKETETHFRGTKQFITSGAEDDKGRWHGWIDISYTRGLNMEHVYTERVYMVHGRRNGICTRTYPDGKVEEEHYLNGSMIKLKKTGSSGLAEAQAFGLLQARYPWYLFMLEAFQFDNQYVENYLDTLETLLYSYTFDPAEFDDYYDQVLDTLSATPYDSLVQYSNTLMFSIGIKRIKDDELRLAVIDHYRSDGVSTFSILETSYPNYVKEMNVLEVNVADLEVFCNDLDDTLAILSSVDPEDSFFIDSVDSRLFIALTSFTDTKKSQTALKSGIAAYTDTDGMKLFFESVKSKVFSKGITTTPPEVADIALTGIILRLLEGDYMGQVVYDAFRANHSIPGLPNAGTEFVSSNSATSVTLNGYVIDDGGADVTARGIAWAEFYNPTVDDQKETSGSGSGLFAVTLDGLIEGNTYFARSYATNSAGTAYGNLISFEAKNTVGIKGPNLPEMEIKLYPNPASESVMLHLLDGSTNNLEVVILDLSGRILQRDAFGSAGGGPMEIRIDVSGIPNGLYNCNLFEDGVPVAGRQLIIAR